MERCTVQTAAAAAGAVTQLWCRGRGTAPPHAEDAGGSLCREERRRGSEDGQWSPRGSEDDHGRALGGVRMVTAEPSGFCWADKVTPEAGLEALPVLPGVRWQYHPC